MMKVLKAIIVFIFACLAFALVGMFLNPIWAEITSDGESLSWLVVTTVQLLAAAVVLVKGL